jgi:hypothetical protein
MGMIYYARRKNGEYFKRFAIDWEKTTVEWTDNRAEAEFFKTREGVEQVLIALDFNYGGQYEIEEIDIEAGQEALKTLAYLCEYDYIEDYDARQDAEKLVKPGG